MIGVWLGAAAAAAVIAWGFSQSGTALLLSNLHGVGIVLGGSLAALLINTPLPQAASAAARLAGLFVPTGFPSPEAAAAEAVRLARKAREEGGILALQLESPAFADGFLRRALVVAATSSEAAQVRAVMEAEIRRFRLSRQEDANVFRTLGILAPMFGLMGTLLGMIHVLRVLTDPSKLGPAMAMALSSALLGIMVANFLCVPVAGRIRLEAMREGLVREILLEGVLAILEGKAPYLVELHLASYARRREAELASQAASPAGRRLAA